MVKIPGFIARISLSSLTRSRKVVALFLLLLAGGLAIATAAEAFRPGQVWLDDHGVPINAHGGGVLFHDGVYYWFGEHKIEGEAGNKAEVGVHCYSSRDLYRWKDEGIALAVWASMRLSSWW